jgi:hypothetical protein
MLRRLKAVAERPGLNPDECWLHKFRSTFVLGLVLGSLVLNAIPVFDE